MIAYKVVERRTRYGTNLALYKRGRSDWRGLKEFVGDLEAYQKILPYFPRYFKGALVEMAPGSVGLMVFERERDAESFRWSYEGRFRTSFRRRTKIVKVSYKADDVLPRKAIMSGCGDQITSFLGGGFYSMSAPTGTIFLKELTVLE